MRKIGLILLVGTLVLGSGESALAFKEFYLQWVEMYVDKDDASEENVAYNKIVGGSKTRCFVCHQGKKKKNRNAYGLHLSELLSKEDRKDTAKIIESLKQVGEIASDPNDEKAETYNQRISKHLLPGGELEKLKEDPKKE